MKNNKFQKQDIDYNKFDKKVLYELVRKYRNAVYRQEIILRKVLQILSDAYMDASLVDLLNSRLQKDVVDLINSELQRDVVD